MMFTEVLLVPDTVGISIKTGSVITIVTLSFATFNYMTAHFVTANTFSYIHINSRKIAVHNV